MWTINDIPDQTGKTAIITGGNTGLGFEVAKALYNKGAHVVIACRNAAKGKSAIAEIKKGSGTGTIEAGVLDLSSIASVKAFAVFIGQRLTAIDMLINNAGIMTPPESITKDGFEAQFGVNYLGHFALVGYLYPILKKTNHSRIVTVTSLAYTWGEIDFNNLKCEKTYDAFREYCQSKLANLMFAIELQGRISSKGDKMLSLAAHPGVAKTEIARHMSDAELAAALERLGPFMEASQGALPILYAAVSADVKEAGFYGPDDDGGLRGFPKVADIQENALNPSISTSLWELSETATGMVF